MLTHHARKKKQRLLRTRHAQAGSQLRLLRRIACRNQPQHQVKPLPLQPREAARTDAQLSGKHVCRRTIAPQQPLELPDQTIEMAALEVEVVAGKQQRDAADKAMLSLMLAGGFAAHTASRGAEDGVFAVHRRQKAAEWRVPPGRFYLIDGADVVAQIEVMAGRRLPRQLQLLRRIRLQRRVNAHRPKLYPRLRRRKSVLHKLVTDYSQAIAWFL